MTSIAITDPFSAVLAWKPPPGIRHEIDFPRRSREPTRVNLFGRSGSRSLAISADATAEDVFRMLDDAANALARR